MSVLSPTTVHTLGSLSYGAVALAIGLESLGVPFPGETTLIAAALYAGATHKTSILFTVAAAACGAVIGDNIGFLIGREFGFRLLVRYGRHIGITPSRIKLGQYLFLRHGGKVVFFGRFVSILRALAAILAGANRMEWRRFLISNALGGIVWSGTYGFGAYFLGKRIHLLLGPIGISISVVLIMVVISWLIILRRNEARLAEEAERAFPGPIKARPTRIQ